MASTYSPNLAITLLGTGDGAGTWGDTTNTNLGTIIEEAISGYVTQAVATGTDTTITIPNNTSGVARNMYIELTGTGGASTNLIVPANKKLYFIFNNTSSGQVTVKVSGQTGISVPNGKKMILVSNGTDIVTAENYVASLSSDNLSLTGTLAVGSTSTFTGAATFTANPVLNGGTANGVLYLNGSKVATSGSALVFDGTNLGIGTASPAQKLSVQGGLTVTGSATLPAAQGPLLFSFESPINRCYMGDGTGYSFAFSKRTASTTTDLVTLTDAGNLGIGTASPTARLHVVGSQYRQNDATGSFGFFINTTAATTRLETLFGGSSFAIRTNGDATDKLLLDSSGNLGLGVTPSAWVNSKAIQFGLYSSLFGTTTSPRTYVGQNVYFDGSFRYIASGVSAGWYQQSGNEHSWSISTDVSPTAGSPVTSSTAMVLTSAGNLGIGTTGSSTVRTSIRGSTADTSANAVLIENSSASQLFRVRNDGFIEAGIGGPLAVTSSGNVGIGTASPAQKLDVKGIVSFQATNSINYWAVYTNTDNTFRINYNAASDDEVVIDTSGNVGIGTASPVAKLSVQDASVPKIALQVGGTERAFLSYTESTFTTRLDSDGPIELAANNAVGLTISTNRNVSAGVPSLSTTATDGFLYVPTCAGTPTGVPTAITGMAPIVVNTTNNKLYFYSGGSWRDAGP